MTVMGSGRHLPLPSLTFGHAPFLGPNYSNYCQRKLTFVRFAPFCGNIIKSD